MKTMRQRTSGRGLAAILALNAIFLVTSGHARQSQAPSPAPPATDPIVGAWKLNVDKSKNPIVATELLTISSRGSTFTLDFEITNDNKFNPHYTIVTDMKGASVKPAYADGRPSENAWSVTRKSPNAFEMDLSTPMGDSTDKYEVSADGTTLTAHRIPGTTGIIAGKMESDGTIHSVQTILVFDRVK